MKTNRDEMISNAAEAVKKNRNGSSITDSELLDGIQIVKETLMFLNKCGREYHLVTADLNRVLSSFEGFELARRRT